LTVAEFERLSDLGFVCTLSGNEVERVVLDEDEEETLGFMLLLV
jgi:hypothetical protein